MDKILMELSHSKIKRIAFIGNYLPRQCGIATFTTDLCESFATQYKTISCIAIAVNEMDADYTYPSRVRFELEENDITSYHRAADFLNINNVDLVCLQHEYGIYGGVAGSHILALLRKLRMPIVSTLHTILKEPDMQQRRVLEEIADLSDRLVVMSDLAVEFLTDIYAIDADKIDMIPHGIPDVAFADPSFHKDLFGVEGKTVLLSFGLLSANKGIEDVIAALPSIVAKCPDVVYMVVGATHPNVLRHDGESYRLSLQALAHKNGVEDHVIFYNRFVPLEELLEFISAADIYVTPYLNPAQITSGTLAYTVGAGKAVISTPYWYAEELLSDGRGVLVPFHKPSAIAEVVLELLTNESKRHAMRKRAFLFGRRMLWSEVTQRYMESFQRAENERRDFPASDFLLGATDNHLSDLPPLKLEHLHQMTDSTGILQHARFTIPNYAEGYTIDDNARALIVATLLEKLGILDANALATRYMAFVAYGFNPITKRFRNFMSYQRQWLEEIGSEDSHGRTIWALGTVLGNSNNYPLQSMAGNLFEQALSSILPTSSPRAWAFSIIGIHEYLRRFSGDSKANQIRNELAERLLRLYQENRSPNWHWFESSLSYCNAVLSQAMLMSGQWIPNHAMSEAGLESLKWLTTLQTAESNGGYFVPIGSNGFYQQGEERAYFDQQPVEAQGMISVCLEAYRSTGDEFWRKQAQSTFEWFLGHNDLNLSLYDPITGGCRDGLHPDRPNENQGAESTLAFLQSSLELRLSEKSLLSLEANSL